MAHLSPLHRTFSLVLSLPLWIAPAAMAVPASLPPKAVAQAPLAIPDVEKRALLLIQDTMAQLKEKQTAIWPGYDLSWIPFVVHRPGKVAYLFNGGATLPPGFEPLKDLPGIAINRHPTGYGEHYSLSAAIGARKGASFPFAFESLNKGATTTLIVHEMFHRFQLDQRFFDGDTKFRQVVSPTDMVWAEIEQLLLADALTADNETAMQRAKEFLAVRRFRQQALTRDSAANETGLETIEGSAFYVENMAEWLAAEPRTAKPLPKGLDGIYRTRQTRLPRLQEMLREAIDENSYSRTRYYLTGIAQCLLLDRWSKDWKQHVHHDHATVPDLLRTTVGLAETEMAGLLNGISQRYDLPGRLAKAPERFKPGETPEQALARFDKSTGRRIALHLSRRFRTGFSMATQTMIEPETLLLGPDSAITSNDQADAIHVVAEILLAFKGKEGTDATFFAPVKVDSLLIDGKPAMDKAGTYKGSIAMMFGKSKIAAKAATVTIAPDGAWHIAIE